MARIVSLVVLTALIVFLGITFYQVLAPFLLPLFLAAVLAMLCRPVFKRLLQWTRQRTYLAAGITTAAVLATILIPLLLVTTAATFQLISVARVALQSPQWKQAMTAIRTELEIDHLAKRVEELTGEHIDPDQLQVQIQRRLREMSLQIAQRTFSAAGFTLNILGDFFSALIGLMMFIIALYYFLADGPALLEHAELLVPVHRDYKRQLLVQFDQAVRAVVLATFAAAVGQGLATGIGLLYFVGFKYFFIVTLLGTMFALVPLLGTWGVWGPVAIWLAWNGQYASAILLTLYGALFVGFLDNVIRTYVLHSNVKLHPLLAFVSVLGGLQALGLWGVFIGPIVASCLHALVKIFNTELTAFTLERFALRGPGLATATPGTTAPLETLAATAVVLPVDSTVTPPVMPEPTRATAPDPIEGPRSDPENDPARPSPATNSGPAPGQKPPGKRPRSRPGR